MTTMEMILVAGLIYAVSLILVLWTAGAIYYDLGRATGFGAFLAGVWIVLVVMAFILWHPPWRPFGVLVVVFILFLRWWFSQKPTQEANWNPHFDSLARIHLEGDKIFIENVRNAEYSGVGKSIPHFEDREYNLSKMRGVDALILNWGSPWMSHPMFVFDFGSEARVCISIEVRYRVGQKYSLLRSLYRQQELIYVVSDERDAILRRTKYMENHDLYLYRLHASQLTIRQFFLEYANQINVLADTPRWYHGLTTNCTTSIYAQGRGRMDWDWTMLFNGKLDHLMFKRKILDDYLPFDQLKQQSWINEIANRAPEKGFGDYLRQELPGYRLDPDEVCLTNDNKEDASSGDG